MSFIENPCCMYSIYFYFNFCVLFVGQNAFQRRVMSPKQLILPNMHVKSLPSKGITNISNTMSTLEDALLASSIWMTLDDQERRSVRYYVKEYAAGHVTPDALVLSLSELLNDHEKVSLKFKTGKTSVCSYFQKIVN